MLQLAPALDNHECQTRHVISSSELSIRAAVAFAPLENPPGIRCAGSMFGARISNLSSMTLKCGHMTLPSAALMTMPVRGPFERPLRRGSDAVVCSREDEPDTLD